MDDEKHTRSKGGPTRWQGTEKVQPPFRLYGTYKILSDEPLASKPPRPRERQAIALALPAMLVIAGAAIWAVVAVVHWVLP